MERFGALGVRDPLEAPVGDLRDLVPRTWRGDVTLTVDDAHWSTIEPDDPAIIGRGGMAIVCRVRDEGLRRTVAMKVLRRELAVRPETRRRFRTEAQLTAQLTHPCIVPVHTLGELPDGRPFFTMKEISGRTLSEVLDEGELPRRRLVQVLRQVSEAVAYAHARGVLHRDLKPSNIMLGEFGEVWVLDWGIARDHRDDPDLDTVQRDLSADRTMHGSFTGTPAYCAPEQARGELDALGPPTDVWAIGIVLYEIIAGKRAFTGTPEQILDAVALGSVERLDEVLGPDLVAICHRALSLAPADRYAHGGELAEALTHWLDGAARQVRARELLARGRELAPMVEAQRAECLSVRASAHGALQLASLSQKQELWRALDRADELERQAAVLDAEVESNLLAAVSHAPRLFAARRALIERYLLAHRLAERATDTLAAARCEALVRPHLTSLSHNDPVRRRTLLYLDGAGRLTLHSDPPGAEVTLFRMVKRARRLEPESLGVVGTTPLVGVPLAHGSWLLTLNMPGRHTVSYPVRVDRGGHWLSAPPGSNDTPQPVVLPSVEQASSDCYVPAGWYRSGGDDKALGALPAADLWVPGFFVQRQPVCNADWLRFLNDLVDHDRVADAIECAPRSGTASTSFWIRDASGHFQISPDEEGDPWPEHYAVALVSYDAAVLYAAWCSARSGLPWRVPSEWELEKAARGVDGRSYPWGQHLDPEFACMRHSHGEYPFPAGPDDFPIDTSVYGVRHLAGNFGAWTSSPWAPGDPRTSGRCAPTDAVGSGSMVLQRGGAWGGSPHMLRCASRTFVQRNNRSTLTSVRLVRSMCADASVIA